MTRTEVSPWTADEAATFLDAVAGDRPAEFFKVLIGSGLRLGEALALRWEDVDLVHRVLRAMHTAYVVHSPQLRRITPTSTAGLRALGAFLGVLHGQERGPLRVRR